MDQVPPSSSKGLTFDFKESEDSPVRSFFNNWIAPQSEPVEMTFDLKVIAAAMKPEINNNWSRKHKNDVSKPARRKIRQIRNLLVDTVITGLQIEMDSLDDMIVMDAVVAFEMLDNPPEPNQNLLNLLNKE